MQKGKKKSVYCKKAQKSPENQQVDDELCLGKWKQNKTTATTKPTRGFRRDWLTECEKFHCPLLPLGPPPTVYVPVILAQDLNSQGKASK